MVKDPVLYKRTTAEIRREIEAELKKEGSLGQPGGVSMAMVKLFGHFADVIINRLNRVPDQHQRAFLNEAEIERLSARPASTELTFTAVADASTASTVPAGTQVANRPVDDQPEIIFETERDLVVIPTSLDACIAIDALNYSDRTAEVRGEKDEPFAIFGGETERARTLYIGHDTLLTFADEASRQHATIVLDFQFEQPADPAADGEWQLEWLYWDGEEWQDLVTAKPVKAIIEDQTENFSRDGVVKFRHLPVLQPLILGGEECVWLACQLTGGTDRHHLPTISDIRIYREIFIPPQSQDGGLAELASISETADDGESVQEHTLYVGHERLFTFLDPISRERAIITLRPEFESYGRPTGDNWELEWQFWNGEEWDDLKKRGAEVEDRTKKLRHDGEIRFSNLPALTVTEVNGIEAVWLAARITGDVDADRVPVFKELVIKREIPGQGVQVNSAMSAVQAGTSFAPLELEGPLMPLGLLPAALDSFYLQVDEAFTKPGATVTIEFTLEGIPEKLEDTTELERLKVEWEYYSSDGWIVLGHGKRTCPVLASFDYEAAGLSSPAITKQLLTQTRFIEFTVPEEFGERDLVGPLKDGTIFTDIYSGSRLVKIPVPDTCKNLSDEALLANCYESERLNFRDSTCAFSGQGKVVVQFDVPDPEDDPPFIKTEIEGQSGYWVRARLEEGSYNVPQKGNPGILGSLLMGDTQFLPPKTYPPVVDEMYVHYANFHAKEKLQPITQCTSKTDVELRSHATALHKEETFRPFTSRADEPALYFGFNPFGEAEDGVAFPNGKWIQFYLDVVENVQEASQRVIWQYWNGSEWGELRTADRSLGLRRSEYLGFYAAADHKKSVEFGVAAFWLRIHPVDMVGSGSELEAPSNDAGRNQTDGTPRLRTLRFNTVPAKNAATIEDELLGFSNGEPDQSFTLSSPPILPDIVLEVREPEAQEYDVISDQVDLPDTLTTIQDVAEHERWVPWQRVTSFYGCGPDSSCYLLDPITGVIQFGNGRRGKIPPPGSDNIRARRYRTHSAGNSNLDRGAIHVLRNASSNLSDIQSVANLSLALGGQEAETIEEVKRRGPQSLKHREKPVTAEDFRWITLESDNVERAYCLPTRNAAGKHKPGWVTMVVVPQSTDVRPAPSPALLRKIRSRLEEIALANLRQYELVDPADLTTRQFLDFDQIHVQGPQYIEVAVHSKVVPEDVEQADEIKVDILQRLDSFMHPLTGGPDGEGWEPGRDVYISEAAAEIENVPGVDHIETLALHATDIQQKAFGLLEGLTVPWELPAGSMVGTIDGRIRMVSGRTLAENERVHQILAYGFKSGDQADIISRQSQEAIASGQRIARVADDGDVVYFARPISWPSAFDQFDLPLLLQNGQLQLEIVGLKLEPEEVTPEEEEEEKRKLVGVVTRGFRSNDLISVAHRDRPRNRVDFLRFKEIELPDDLMRIYVPHDHLISSGPHKIEMALRV